MTTATHEPQKNLTHWLRDLSAHLGDTCDGLDFAIGVLNTLRTGDYENDPVATTLLLDRAIHEAEQARDDVRSGSIDLRKITGPENESSRAPGAGRSVERAGRQ